MQHTMMDFPLTLPSLLERAREPFADVEIVSRRGDRSVERTTYGAFYKRARALAEALLARGLQKGDRVATLMWNHEAHLAAYFGIPIAGGVLHTLNLRLSPEDVAFIAEHAGDRFLIVDESLLPTLEKCPFKRKLEAIFVVGKGPFPPGYESFEALLASATGSFSYPDLGENDAMGMCYTSGTTGRPKGVVYSHRSTVLHCFATAMADGLAVGMRDTILPVVPQFHVNAWGIPYTATMVGAKLVMPGPFLDALSVLDLLESERVTLAAGVPTVWLGIIEALEKEPTRWKLQAGLRMVVGGSAVPESMLRRFDRFDMRVIHAWGMTETSPIGTVSHVRPSFASRSLDEQYAVRAKQGINMPFVEMRTVDDAGTVLARDGVTSGELEVRGPWVAASYFDPDEAGATAKRWSDDGWFRTGDVATIDEHGHMKITDRAKDVIKSGGEWISSVDLENALMGHPEVREGSTPAVAAELHALLASKFVKWWLPDGYVFVESIPRTSAGKFLKAALREEYKSWKPAATTEPPKAGDTERAPPARP